MLLTDKTEHPQISNGQGQGFGVVALLRGDGPVSVKSEALLFVSTHPAPALLIAVVLLSSGLGLPSAKPADP